MPRRERTIESRIAEYKKYRRQCKVRIKPSVGLCVVALLVSAFIVWRGSNTSDSWLIAGVVTGIPLLFTAMEILGYYRHDKAVKKLESA